LIRAFSLAWAKDLKLFKGLLHDSKGDANLQGLGVIDPLDLQIPERLGWSRSQSSLVPALIRTSAMPKLTCRPPLFAVVLPDGEILDPRVLIGI
jgi:hypothetical protein